MSITSGGPILLAEKDYGIPRFANTQVNKIFEDMNVTGEVEEALAYVTVLSGGRVYAYASSVDDGTGDAEFIPAMKD